MTTGTTTESILARIAVDCAWISGVGVGGRTGLDVGAHLFGGDFPSAASAEQPRHVLYGQGHGVGPDLV